MLLKANRVLRSVCISDKIIAGFLLIELPLWFYLLLTLFYYELGALLGSYLF